MFMYGKKHIKLLIIITAITLSLIIVAGSLYVYVGNHPNVQIGISNSKVYPEQENYENHYEMITVTVSSLFNIPASENAEKKLHELADWINEIDQDIRSNYTVPLNIEVSGEVKNGKTTFCYKGYATTLDGKRVEYNQEKTFDFLYTSNDDLLVENN